MSNRLKINIGFTNSGTPIDDTLPVYLKRSTTGGRLIRKIQQTFPSLQLESEVLVWKITMLPLQHGLVLHNWDDLMKETGPWKSIINCYWRGIVGRELEDQTTKTFLEPIVGDFKAVVFFEIGHSTNGVFQTVWRSILIITKISMIQDLQDSFNTLFFQTGVGITTVGACRQLWLDSYIKINLGRAMLTAHSHHN